MQNTSLLKFTCVILCAFLLLAEITSAAPTYGDYESNIRDLYDYLMQKEALDERLNSHQMVRKSGRTPSLRLRFGRRSDPSLLPASPYLLAAQEAAAEHADN